METKEKDIIHENGKHWVLKRPDGKGYEVYRSEVAYSVRVARFGSPDRYRQLAIKHCERLETGEGG